MDVSWRQIGSFVGGTISSSAIPALGSLFTQAQIDAADVMVVYVSAAVNWNAAAGTVALTGNNGIPLQAESVTEFRGKEIIQNLSFIRKSSDAIMTACLFGGRS